MKRQKTVYVPRQGYGGGDECKHCGLSPYKHLSQRIYGPGGTGPVLVCLGQEENETTQKDTAR